MAGIFNLSSLKGNLVCDAVADPPRLPNNKIPTKIPEAQPLNQDQSNKTVPNPPASPVNDQDTASANDSKSDETKDFKPSAPKNNEKSKPTKETSNSINNNGPKKKEFKEMSAQVLKLSKSEKEITTEDMLLIKIHLGKWREVAEKLDLSEGEIEQLYEDYKSLNTTEVVYQMLVKWHQKKSKAATVGCLVSAMWSCQAYDCVEKLVQSYCDRENIPNQI